MREILIVAAGISLASIVRFIVVGGIKFVTEVLDLAVKGAKNDEHKSKS